MKKSLFNILKYITLFFIGSIVYMTMEIMWKGETHWTMGVLGGICLIIIGLINELFSDIPLLYQGFIGSIIITFLEYFSGMLLNVKLGLGIWDYSMLPWNVDGQVCLYFSIIWIFVSMFASILDDAIRVKLFKEAPKATRFF